MAKYDLVRFRTGAPKRPMYQTGDYFFAQNLLTEQRCLMQRFRRHNRYLHGWGVVCGLWIAPSNDLSRPWAVQVCPGYAIGPCGDEIEVLEPTMVSVHDYLWRRPQNGRQLASLGYIGVRHAEQLVRPVPAKPLGCGCKETVYQPSRIRDGFHVDVLWELPPPDQSQIFDLCEQETPASCPASPDSLYVLLACITLPASENDPITAEHIDNWSCRRQI